VILLNNPQDIFSVAPTYYFCTYLRAAMLWGCGRNPGPVPGTQTKWASFEASAVSDLPPENCLRVFTIKIMGPSHASDLLGTTKVRIQLWSFLNRCPGQSIQRGYNRWAKGHKHPPVHRMPIMTPWAKLNQHPPAYHPLDVHYEFHW